MKIIFLDIDGVLNNHTWNEKAKSNSIDRSCVEHLNAILRATGANIVLSSAWRYMVHGEAMTLRGFEYLLRTHGVECVDKVVGLTRKDAVIDNRSLQIMDYLINHPEVTHHVVLDDLDLPQVYKDRTFRGLNFVRTEEHVGLTEDDAEKAINILGRKPSPYQSLADVLDALAKAKPKNCNLCGKVFNYLRDKRRVTCEPCREARYQEHLKIKFAKINDIKPPRYRDPGIERHREERLREE